MFFKATNTIMDWRQT